MNKSHTVRIWVAGDYADAVRCVKAFCAQEGACFAVAPADFIYSGGAESGVCVTLINYARFPASPEMLNEKAKRLADVLLCDLFQKSYSIEGPEETEWFSVRPND